MTLQELFATAVRAHAPRVAIEDGDRSITYAELDRASDAIRDALIAAGVRPGARVGVCLAKSIDSVTTIIATLKAGAAYVPLDVSAPIARSAYVLDNCEVAVAVVAPELEGSLATELATLGRSVRLLTVAACRSGAPPARTHAGTREDLAYLLYTSGSTGKPKGVALSHDNALSYVRWCSETLEPTSADRFSSHAPFHFDLSILDLYTPWMHGATLVLIDDRTAREPMMLAKLAAERRISIWYSTPTILAMMAQAGRMERYDFSAMRIVCFAGEVFPVVHLRRVKKLLPANARFLNLYGPTETNVCTWYELPPNIPDDRSEPYPIGKACSHYEAKVIGDGDRGELVVRGPAVMQGYWGLAEQTARAFHVDPDGSRWYRTGDIVWVDSDGNYVFAGRADRMIKKRGYRIELGEIESCLYVLPDVKEAAVIASTDKDGAVSIHAFVSVGDRAAASVIAFKQACAARLPMYMVPDVFWFLDALPHTSTDKVDLQALRATLSTRA